MAQACERKILLIEDNPDDAYLTRRALEAAQFCHPLVVIPKGQLALDYLKREGEYTVLKNEPLPILTIIDIRLNGMTGLDVLRKIRKNEATRLLKVAMLTQSEARQDKIEALRLGVVAFMTKPITDRQIFVIMPELDLKLALLDA